MRVEEGAWIVDGQQRRLVTLPVELRPFGPEARSVLKVERELRVDHVLHAEGAFWRPAYLDDGKLQNVLSATRLMVRHPTEAFVHPAPFGPATGEEAALFSTCSAREREAVERMQSVVDERIRLHGRRLFCRSEEPMLVLTTSRRNFNETYLEPSVPGRGHGESPHITRFSVRRVEAVQELRRAIRPKGLRTPAPVVDVADPSLFMDVDEERRRLVAGVKEWLATLLAPARIGMMPVEFLLAHRSFATGSDHGTSALRALIGVVSPPARPQPRSDVNASLHGSKDLLPDIGDALALVALRLAIDRDDPALISPPELDGFEL